MLNLKPGERTNDARLSFLLLCALFLSACAPALTPAPPLTTAWLRVQISPALSTFDTLFSTCTPEGIGLAIQQATGTAFPEEQADLILRLGASPDSSSYAVQLSQEEVVLVVHPSNPVQSITLPALKATYTGDLPGWDWDFLGQPTLPLTAYLYPENSDLQAIVRPGLFPEGQLAAREVVIAPGPAEMRAAVAGDPGAIGFLPRRWVDASVRTISVDGLPAGAWSLPILALSDVEPQGSARDWLLCVQEGMRADGG